MILMKMTKTNRNKWIRNQIIFLRPVIAFTVVLYIGFVIPRVEKNGIQLIDFMPTNGVITAWVLYLLNGVYDYFRKMK